MHTTRPRWGRRGARVGYKLAMAAPEGTVRRESARQVAEELPIRA